MEKSGDQGDAGAMRDAIDVVLALGDRLAAVLRSELSVEIPGRLANDRGVAGATRDTDGSFLAYADLLAEALGPEKLAELSRRLAVGQSDPIADKALVDWAFNVCGDAMVSFYAAGRAERFFAAERAEWPDCVDRESPCAQCPDPDACGGPYDLDT